MCNNTECHQQYCGGRTFTIAFSNQGAQLEVGNVTSVYSLCSQNIPFYIDACLIGCFNSVSIRVVFVRCLAEAT